MALHWFNPPGKALPLARKLVMTRGRPFAEARGVKYRWHKRTIGLLGMIRPDETWHRLRDWTYGQAQSERLAALILAQDGYSRLDPSHPLGGRDGGRDAVCLRDGVEFTMAAYFPRGQQGMPVIKRKFLSDLAKTDLGLVFVTNQEILLSQRTELIKLANGKLIDVFHLERIAHILERPEMRTVRAQYLFIEDPRIEPFGVSQAAAMEQRLQGLLTGGDAFCYWTLAHFDVGKSVAQNFMIIKQGKNALFDVSMRIINLDNPNKNIFARAFGEISAPALAFFPRWDLLERVSYRAFFAARNGQWHQDLHLVCIPDQGYWAAATRVYDIDGRTIRLEKVDPEYVSKAGIPAWGR